MLTIFTMVSFKAHSTRFSISDTLETPEHVNLDSIRKLVPIGFYILSEKGAKKSLKASIDAVVYHDKWQIADKALAEMANRTSLVTTQRNQAIDLNIKKDAQIAGLTKKLLWANIWKWTAVGASAYLTTKVIFK